jgi:hypothetical protein
MMKRLRVLLSSAMAIGLVVAVTAPVLAYHDPNVRDLRLRRLDPIQCGSPITLEATVWRRGGGTVSGVTVNWELLTGQRNAIVAPGDSIAPATSVSDANGRAYAELTLDCVPGKRLVEAEHPGDARDRITIECNRRTCASSGDNASLNIRKVDEDGRRLPGAVFTVAGMSGEFTTDSRGHFCVTGLANDSTWTVTEVRAPDGYELADEPSQVVEVDDDGDCGSPDAVFVNTVADEAPNEGEEPGTPPQGGVAPGEGTLGGNPTPAPQAGVLPDTASFLGSVGSSVPLMPIAALVLGSVTLLVAARMGGRRR